MIPFNPEKASFGRHETFPLRYGWLTKGFRAWRKNPDLFNKEDSTVTLGVGKNMVNAIRYWMLASRILKGKGNVLESTDLGQSILSKHGWDPFLEDETTIWLIHWLISSNPENATTIFWFFNFFHKSEFSQPEIFASLREFVVEHTSLKISDATLKHDITLLLRMYESRTDSKYTPLEETLDSPLSSLGMIQKLEVENHHQSKPENRRRLPAVIVWYAIAELFEQTQLASLPVERLLYSDKHLAAPGSVFRLTEDGLLSKVEEIIHFHPGYYELRETAGVNQVYQIKSIMPLEILEHHYSQFFIEKG